HTRWPRDWSSDVCSSDLRQRDHARNDEDEHREELQECREDRAAPRLALVPRPQGTLHDVLIGGPIPQPDDRGAEQHAEPWVVARSEERRVGKECRWRWSA